MYQTSMMTYKQIKYLSKSFMKQKMLNMKNLSELKGFI